MDDFIMQYGVCILLCAIGLFFVAVTYYAAFFSGRSGVPLIGGFCIALGFLTSPVKWLALLGLIDPGYFGLVFVLIRDNIRSKRFDSVYAQHDYAESERSGTEHMRIWIPERDEELIQHYATRHMYQLNIPKLVFSVCKDKAGRRYILVDKCIKGGQIEILPFDEGHILLCGRTAKNAEMTVEVEVVKDEITQ